MSASKFIEATERDAKIIDALHLARYALVIHHSLPFECEGERGRLDFTEEVEKIDAVMTMLGVDLTEPLPAPKQFPEVDDEDLHD